LQSLNRASGANDCNLTEVRLQPPQRRYFSSSFSAAELMQ